MESSDIARGGGTDAGAEPSEVLGLVGDADCRAVIAAVVGADGAPSVAELAASLGVPESTLYRKLDRLTATPLVDERAIVSTDGHPKTRYVSGVTGVTIRFDGEPPVTVETADGETVALDVADATDSA